MTTEGDSGTAKRERCGFCTNGRRPIVVVGGGYPDPDDRTVECPYCHGTGEVQSGGGSE